MIQYHFLLKIVELQFYHTILHIRFPTEIKYLKGQTNTI